MMMLLRAMLSLIDEAASMLLMMLMREGDMPHLCYAPCHDY